jgi:osmotically-inducible protein OsmY
MFRTLFRLVVLLVLLVGVGAFFIGWWGGGRTPAGDRPDPAVGTTGRVDTGKAKEVGAEIGARTADAANKAGAVLSDGALTAKIKSKMALDDLVKARTIDVTTTNHVVTLAGTVTSAGERDRAVRLAKETAGVREVVDRLTVGR